MLREEGTNTLKEMDWLEREREKARREGVTGRSYPTKVCLLPETQGSKVKAEPAKYKCQLQT